MYIFNKIKTAYFLALSLFLTFPQITLSIESDVIVFDSIKNNQTQLLSDFDVQYVEDIQGITVLNFTGNYDVDINGIYNFEARQAVLQQFYSNHDDIYDFIYIFTEFDFDTGELAAFATPIFNDVAGIGKPLYDNRADFFSGKLQSVIDMASMNRYQSTPSTPFQYDFYLGTLMHETMHRWGISVNYIDIDSQFSNRLLGRDESHYSYFLNSNASVMYGSLWNEYEPNSFETTDISHGLSPLDLYLAGFIQKESVPDFFVINNGSVGSNTDLPPSIGTTIQGNREPISIDDVIAYEGERIPNAINSQHEFKIKFILLKEVNEVTNSQSIARLFVLGKEFQKRFFADTNGIGAIVLPKVLNSLAINDPISKPYNPQLNTNFDLQKAVEYLQTHIDGGGFWKDKNSTTIRDTVTVIKALQLIIDDYPQLQVSLNEAILWLNNHQASNNDELAWMLRSGVLSTAKKQEVLNELSVNEYATGGWGLESNTLASSYDAALVLNSLYLQTNSQFTATDNTRNYIADNINSDFGFSYVSGGQSNIVSSALLLQIIDQISLDQQDKLSLINYLLSQKQADNSYGQDQGTPHETALVINALTSLNDSQYQVDIDLAKSALNQMQSIDGSMQGSIYSTALAIKTLYADTKANLQFSSVIASNTNIVAGEQILVQIDVYNSGVLNAENTELTIYENSIDPNNIKGQIAIASIQPQEHFATQISLDSTGFSSNATLLVVLDQSNSVNESNENDNLYIIDVLVTQPSSTPELVFNNEDFIINPTQFEVLPFTFDATVSVANLSLISTNGVIIRLSRLEANGDIIELDSQSISIAALSSQIVNFNNEILQANTSVELFFTIDPDNLIDEVNEENNSYRASIQKLQSIDLEVLVEDITIPSQIIVGVDQEIVFSYRNSGTELSPSFNLKAYAEFGGVSQLIYETSITEINGGEQQQRIIYWQPQSQGNYNLRFALDEENQIAETDENNNEIMVSVNVVANSLSNLSIAESDITLMPSQALQGQDLQLTLNVHNTSDIDSGIFDATVYQKMPIGTPNIVLANSVNNTSILAGDSQEVSFNLVNTNLSRDIGLIFEVDSAQNIEEFNENDNIVFKNLTVLTLPDLQVSAGGFELIPSIPVLGQSLSVQVAIRNLGEQNSTQFDASLYFDNSQNNAPVLIETKTINEVIAGELQYFTFTFNFPNDANIDTLILKVDELESINEGNENNNNAQILVGNQNSLLYVTNRYFSPNSDGIKDETSIVFNAEMVSNYNIKISDSNLNIIKSFDSSLFQSTSFGDAIWNGINDRGVLERDGDYSVQLINADGIIIASTPITLDTNNSPLLSSLAENNGYVTDLNCLVNFSNSQLKFSHDGDNLFTTSYMSLDNILFRGFFKIKNDGSKIAPELSEQFLINAQQFDYKLLDNGDILFSFKQDGLYKLYLKDFITNTLVLLNSTVSQSHIFSYTSDFVIMEQTSNNQLTKYYYDTSIPIQQIQFPDYIHQVHQLTNGLLIMQQDSNAIDESDLYFQSFDFNVNAQLLDTGFSGTDDFEIKKPKNISSDFRNFIYRKNNTLNFYTVSNNNLELVFSENVLQQDNFGFTSHNELFILNENQEIIIYNGSGNQLLETSPSYLNSDFNLDGMTNINVNLGGEEPYNFLLSEMFDPYIEQKIIDYTDYTDKKELLLLVKNSLIGQFLTPECDDFGMPLTVQCYEWQAITKTPVKTVFTLIRLDYSDRLDLDFEVIEVGEFDFHNTSLNFSSIQEGRSQYLLENITTESIIGLLNRNNLSELAGLNNIYTDAITDSAYPHLFESIGYSSLKSYYRTEIFSEILLNDNNLAIESQCGAQSSSPKYIYRSYDNLFTDLILTPQQSGVEISAVTFDKYFDKLELYWSFPGSPDNWNIVYSLNEKLLQREIIYNWVPPFNALYNLKLVAYDKAGNTHSEIDQISINNADTSIRNISLDNTYFSPNGDSIKDTVTIQYDVLSATELIVEIQDESGLVVRSYSREYISPTNSELIFWNGKDQNGILLEDGKYQISIQGFHFNVYLDTLPIIINDIEMSFQYRPVMTRLHFPNVDSESIKLRQKPDFSSYNFQVFNTTTGSWQNEDKSYIQLHSDTFVDSINSAFRLKIEDKAGNIGVSPIITSVENFRQAIVLKKDSFGSYSFTLTNDSFPSPQTAASIVDWSYGNKISYVIQPFNYEPIESIRFTTQYTDATSGEIITQSKLVSSLLPEDAALYLSIDFPNTGVNSNSNYLSDINVVNTQMPVFVVELDKSDFPDTKEIITVNFEIKTITSSTPYVTTSKIQFDNSGLGPTTKINIKKLTLDTFLDTQGLSENALIAYSNISNSVPYNDDLEYYWVYMNRNINFENNLLYVEESTGSNTIYSPDIIDNTDGYYSMLYITPKSPCKISRNLTWRAIKSNGNIIESNTLIQYHDLCIKPKVEVMFYLGEFCDTSTQGNNTINIQVLTDEINPQSNLPFLVEVYRKTALGYDDLIFADTSPAFTENANGTLNYSTSFLYDISQLPQGQHGLKVLISDFSGNIVSNINYFEIDNITATNQINTPVNNAKICADEEESGAIVFDLNGQVNLSSKYGAQMHIIANGKSYNNNSSLEYQGFNSFDLLTKDSSNITLSNQFNIPRYSGTASLILETFNASGVDYCSTSTVTIDSLVDYTILDPVLHTQQINQDNYLSPNNDGVKDTIAFSSIQAHESLFVEMSLFAVDDLNNSLGIVSTDSLSTNDNLDLVWDAQLSNTVVADGKYFVVIKLTDGCNLTKSFRIPVTVDTVQPTNEFIQPLDLESLNLIQRIVINIYENNLRNENLSDQIIVDYFYNNVWNEVEILSINNTSNGVNQIQLDWNLTNLPAAVYPLRVSTTDLAGNLSSEIINPELISTQDILWNYSISELFISPNADTILDSTSINFGLNTESLINIIILDENQVIVRDLVTEEIYSPQSHEVIFYGLDNNNQILADGVYYIEISATETANLGNTAILQLPIILDTIGPSIDWVVPSGGVTKAQGYAQVTLSELHPHIFEVYNQKLQPIGANQLVVTSTATGLIDVLDLSLLEETQYQLSAQAIDLAGNTTSSIFSYVIDNTPPQVDLINPLNMNYVDGNSILAITGSINDDNFDHYEMSLSLNTDPFNWQTIQSGTTLNNSLFNYEWNLTVNGGNYLLRISAYDQAGWVTHISHEIIIDKTYATAEISEPISQTIIGSEFPIIGTATDENFSLYSLSYKRTNDSEWVLFGLSQTPVTNSNLGNLPESLPSGEYDIKLTVEDKVGLNSEVVIPIILDADAPPTPLNLSVEKVNNQVNLQWENVNSSDLSGYLVYRNQELITSQLLINNSYVDTNLNDGEYVYSVISVDDIGNRSQYSNEVLVIIDTTPPDVLIISPHENQLVNNTIDIVGTARSLLDFNSYNLYYREMSEAVPGAQIQQSSIPVTSSLLGVLDTTSLLQNHSYILRLEAEDNSGNVAVVEKNVFVDNIAPNAPLNLTHQLQGANNVLLQWSANSESDLAGYIILQNGIVISGNGDGLISIANAIVDLNFLVENLVDGNHVFEIIAIDQTGNISQTSNAVSQNINIRAPDTIITAPMQNLKFELPLLFKATGPDNDIAEIRFEYSIDNSNWILLAIDQQQPFQATLNPVNLNLSFGTVYLRATATDTSLQSDNTPAQVSVEYADLTAPLEVQGFSATINGGDITLSWNANTESDLQGYVINRIFEGQTTQVTNANYSSLTFTDTGLINGEYDYSISAIDNDSNESTIQIVEMLDVFSITTEQPFSPLISPAEVQLLGTTPKSIGVIKSSIINTNGSNALADLVFNDNSYISPMISLVEGINTFDIYHELSLQHKSKTNEIQVEVSPIPEIPTNFQVNTSATTNTLSWNNLPQTIAYLPYKNSVPLYPYATIDTGISYTTSSTDFPQESNVSDGNVETYWRPSYNDFLDSSLTFFEIDFDQMHWVTDVKITWLQENNEVLAPVKYTIQYESTVGWVTAITFEGTTESIVTYTNTIPYMTNKVRLVINNVPGIYERIGLAEFEIIEQPLLYQNTIDIIEIDGSYSYQVSSINNYGFESFLTTPIVVDVGDVIPPQAPLALTASDAGSNDVYLTWEPSSSIDVMNYWLFRNNEVILITPDANQLDYTDIGLTNGQYEYTARAVDMVGNQSSNSNTASISVLLQPMPIPLNLSGFAVLSGNATQLNWDAVNSPRLNHYDVYRSLSIDGNYNAIASIVNNNFNDTNLQNGTEYFYKVTSVDEFNNQSDYSQTISITPNDRVAANSPVLNSPTTSSNAITINSITTNVSGVADADVLIDLYVNNQYKRTTRSSSTYLLQSQNAPEFDKLIIPKFGVYFAYTNFFGSLVVEDNNHNQQGNLNEFIEAAVWNSVGEKLYAILYDDISGSLKLSTFDVGLNEIGVVFTENSIDSAVPSPDESMIFYQGDYTDANTQQTSNGVWIYNPSTSIVQSINIQESITTNNNSIAWSNNGENIAFVNQDNGNLYLFNINNQSLTLIDTMLTQESRISWSSDNTQLIYDKNDGIVHLTIYNLLASQSFNLPMIGNSFRFASFLEDQNTIVYLLNSNQVIIYNIETNTSNAIYSDPSMIVEMVFNHSIGLMIFSYDTNANIKLPGYFNFDNVQLEVGDNQLYAIARDDSGIPSVPSLPISINVASTNLIDLILDSESFIVSPEVGLQGTRFVGSAQVINNSSQVLMDVNLKASLTKPDGEVITGLLVPNQLNLQPYETYSLFIDAGIANIVGEYVVQITVDDNNLIEESNENNNSAFHVFTVLENLNPTLDMFVAPEVASPNQPIFIDLNVFNPSESFTGKLMISIKDQGGFPVQEDVEIDISNIPMDEYFSSGYQWSTANILSGQYQIETNLIDSRGLVLRQVTQQVEIIALAEFAISLNIDNNNIVENGVVQFNVSVNYINGNTPQNGSLIWQIVDENQQVIWNQSTQLPLMLVNYSATFNQQWQAQQAPGSYKLNLQFVADNDQQMLSVPFVISSASPQANLTGIIDQNPTVILLGHTLTVSYELNNTGNIDLSDVPIRLEIMSSDLQTIVASTNTTITLLENQVQQLNHEFSQNELLSLTVDSYLITLYADLSAYFGDVNHLIDTRSIEASDVTAPEIIISSPINGTLYSDNVELRYSIFDQDSDIAAITLTSIDINQGSPVAVNINTINQLYSYLLHNLTQGQHQITITASDSKGNSSQQSISYQVDPIAPVITITGVEEGFYYNQTVTIDVSIIEDNPLTSEILLNNVAVTSPYEITQEGNYFLSVRAQDSAGNLSTRNLHFALDFTAPEIVITYPLNNVNTVELFTPIVGYTEVNAIVDLSIAAYNDQITADNNGFFRFVDVPVTLGANTISLQATDLAANQGVQQNITINVVSALDITGSITGTTFIPIEFDSHLNFTLNNNSTNDYVDLAVKIELYSTTNNQLIETKSTSVSLLANQTIESDFDFIANSILADKYHVILSVFVDNQWIQKDDTIMNFVVTEFGLHVNLPLNQGVYTDTITTSVEVTDAFSTPPDVQYKLDNAAWVSMVYTGNTNYIANLVSDDGIHLIEYRINDNNTITSTIASAVFNTDTLAPEITITNPTNGLITNQVVMLDYNVDDLHLISNTALLNGQQVQTGDLISNDGDYELIITAQDIVNNQSTQTVQFIIDTINPEINLTNIVENQQFTMSTINIVGNTEPYALITLDIGSIHYSVTADEFGVFELINVELAPGANSLLFNATDRANNSSNTLSLTLYYNDLASCQTFGFQTATPYNAMIFNDYIAQESSVEGRLAVGGNINISQYYIGQQLTESTAGDVLIAGGNIDFSDQQIYFGNILTAGQATIGQVVQDNMQTGAQILENTQLPIDFVETYQQMRLFSNALNEQITNSTTLITGQNMLIQEDCATQLQVYHIDATELENINTMTYDCLGNESYIILNIAGTSVQLNPIDTSQLTPIHQNIIWNFYQAQELELFDVKLQGSVLAVDANIVEVSTTNANTPNSKDPNMGSEIIFSDSFDVDYNRGFINGQLIASTFTNQLQLKQQPLNCNATIQINAAPIVADLELTTVIDTALSFTIDVLDEDSQNLTFQIINPVVSGQITGTMPNLTYLPNTGYTGTDEFSYQVTDSSGKTSTATVTITITAVQTSSNYKNDSNIIEANLYAIKSFIISKSQPIFFAFKPIPMIIITTLVNQTYVMQSYGEENE
jgi:choice-of-anchor A domain-containing protein